MTGDSATPPARRSRRLSKPERRSRCFTKDVQRLSRRPDYLSVARGLRWVTPGFIVQALPVAEGRLRIGFTVSRKVGNAVVRNRVKRRLRAVARETLAAAARPGHDIVLIGRTEAQHQPYERLCKDLKWALRRLDLAPTVQKDPPC